MKKPLENYSYSLCSHLHINSIFGAKLLLPSSVIAETGLPITLVSAPPHGGSYVLHPALEQETKVGSGTKRIHDNG